MTIDGIRISAERLSAEIEELAGFSADAAPAVTRLVFSAEDRAARAWLAERARAAGLASREDAVGNTFFRWVGSEPELPAVATGSHIDAIPHSGRFDGTVGVLGGLEAIRALQAAGFRPKRSIELILFTSEEPTRFGIGCLGSRLMAGVLGAEADGFRDRSDEGSEGQTLRELRTAAGFAGELESVRLERGHYSAFLELHIEQGPLLEHTGVPLGVVTAIAAPSSDRIVIHGEGGHAGGRLMVGRQDALCAASELTLAVEAAALAAKAVDTVATVGVCRVHPGAVNSIPSLVEMMLDLRDTDSTRRDTVYSQIRTQAAEIAHRRRVEIRFEPINADTPEYCSASIRDVLEAVAGAAGLAFRWMISRAYHDTLFMARITPVGMLFLPCRGGISHRPDEFASAEDIARSAGVLAGTLARLSVG